MAIEITTALRNRIHAGQAEEVTFIVVEGRPYESCSCIHFSCPWCGNEASIAVPVGGITPYFSATCDKDGKTFLIHWS